MYVSTPRFEPVARVQSADAKMRYLIQAEVRQTNDQAQTRTTPNGLNKKTSIAVAAKNSRSRILVTVVNICACVRRTSDATGNSKGVHIFLVLSELEIRIRLQ